VRGGGRWLVHDIDLDVRRREIVTLIGPNGGGKTTVLRALLGLIAADAGTVERAAGLAVGYVPQRLDIDAVLPLAVARLMTLTAPRRRDEIARALAETGVEEVIDQPVQELSGGEFQRVLLARALLGRPDLLVLDEPVQGVDFAGEAALYELIGGLRRRFGCGILLVSHDLHVVMAATDRVLCLNHHICCTGAPREVAEHAEYRRLFGARAVEAYALYHHTHDHDLAGGVVPHPHAGGRPD
jgi:zinc transport system ATP-binding protein